MWSFFSLGGGGSLMWSFFLGPSLMWSLFFFGAQFDVEFVIFWAAVWCRVCFFWGPVWCGVFFFWGPVWCGVCFLGAQFDVEFVIFWAPVWCRVCFFWGPVWCGVFFSGAQFDVEFFFLGAQFDVEFFFGAQFYVEFVFLVPSLMWSLFIVGRSLMWSLCFGGSLRGPSLAQLGFWHKESSLAHGFCAESTAISDWRWNTSCVPACLPASLTHSLTHSLSHAWRKQGCTWQSPSERAWLPGRGTWEKDYAEPNWRIRTCAFSRGSRCPMMIMMMSAAIHCSILHTYNNIYI